MAQTTLNVDELHRKWYKPIRSWIRKRGDIPKLWVEDIAQEVFVRLMVYDPDIDTNTIGYVFRIANNIANEWTQRSFLRRDHVASDLDEHVFGVDRSPEELLEEIQEERERTEIIERAMSKLEGRRLLVLMLHVYERKTYNQIAEEMGLTYRTVLRELVRAYAQLRIDLKHLSETYTPVEEIDNGRNDDGPIETKHQNSGADLRFTASDVGSDSRIHSDGAANRPVLDLGTDKQSAAGGQKG